MSRYTGQEIAQRAIRFGASPALARIMGAAAMAEGGGDSEAVGDNGTSLGAFQVNDIHGLTRAQRLDLDFITQWMYEHEFQAAYFAGLQRGYTDEQLARWTAMAAERPWGWQGPNAPGLDSAAASGYAAQWRALGDTPMPDLRQAFLNEIRQHFGTPYVFGAKGPTDFDCSGLLTYSARQVGLDLGDPLMTSADGLKGYCDLIPLEDVLPGDLYLFHTTYGDGGPFYATHCGAALGDGTHMLDDHGDPWPGCGQTDLTTPYWQEHLMGAWRPRGYGAPSEEDDPVKLAEAENTIDYLKGDVADAFEAAITTLENTPKLPKAARDAVASGLRPALETLRRGGSPE